MIRSPRRDTSDTGVHALQRNIREVTIGNHPCLVSAIMLAVIDKMGTDLLVSCQR
jgi:hypothetical protein